MSHPKCYLFDLNGTLIFRTKSKNTPPELHIRPHTLELLKYLSTKNSGTTRIYIATSMIYKNVVPILNCIYPQWNTIISGIFDNAYTIQAPTKEYPYRTLRNVRKIAYKLNMRTTDLIFVDNDLYKYPRGITNVIIVSSYTGNPEDSELSQVFKFL